MSRDKCQQRNDNAETAFTLQPASWEQQNRPGMYPWSAVRLGSLVGDCSRAHSETGTRAVFRTGC
jgi:hypothetical protein